MNFKTGSKVKLAEEIKEFYTNTSHVHVNPYHNSVGIVEGLVDYNHCKPKEPGYDPELVGPEIRVMWPDNKVFEYHPDDLMKSK